MDWQITTAEVSTKYWRMYTQVSTIYIYIYYIFISLYLCIYILYTWYLLILYIYLLLLLELAIQSWLFEHAPIKYWTNVDNQITYLKWLIYDHLGTIDSISISSFIQVSPLLFRSNTYLISIFYPDLCRINRVQWVVWYQLGGSDKEYWRTGFTQPLQLLDQATL